MSVVILACALFSVGLFGVLARRDTVAILASVEVMLGGPLLLLVALAGGSMQPAGAAVHIEGIALLVVVVIAAEAAVGLALLVSVARKTRSTALDDLTEVKG
ncbi:MAG: NADH-quinone oxidoreductase subunit NuoK [Coriobacteriia bacterium]|nr:NADH-quinone oxidoreductase subunit NuoK [Coriobacteriia bacterium]